MPLSMVKIGEKKTIISLHGEDTMKQHLLDLGFVSGQQVEIVGKNPHGLILSLKGVRLALNRGLAQRINVA